MNRESKIDFYKYTHTHLENRIQFLDQKASIMIGVLSIVMGSVIVESVVSMIKSKKQFHLLGIDWMTYVWLSTNIIFMLVILYLLLCVVKPSSRDKLPKYRKVKYLMWHSPKDFQEDGLENYIDGMDSLSDNDVVENYKKIIYISKFLLHKKYKNYGNAMNLLKKLIVIDSLIIIGLIISRLLF